MFAKKHFNVAELNTNLCKNEIKSYKNYNCYEQSVSIKLAKLGHLSLLSKFKNC